MMYVFREVYHAPAVHACRSASTAKLSLPASLQLAQTPQGSTVAAFSKQTPMAEAAATLCGSAVMQQATHNPSSSDYGTARHQFPYFNKPGNPIFMENAGGSQVPQCVIDAICDYMKTSYAQVGAGYSIANTATATVDAVHKWMNIFMNVQDSGEVLLGSSTSQLIHNLSDSYARMLQPGDVIIVQESNHEANIGPWVRAAERSGATLSWWRVDPVSGSCPLSDLQALLTPQVKIVAVGHVSNILGDILDVAELVRQVKAVAPDARVVVDGVSLAPHRAIDVTSWAVDWYVFSTYKTWGPHMAVMFGRTDAFQALGTRGAGLNHYFVPPNDYAYKFELGCLNHEGCAGLLALQDYLLLLSQMAHPGAGRAQAVLDPAHTSGCAVSAERSQAPQPPSSTAHAQSQDAVNPPITSANGNHVELSSSSDATPLNDVAVRSDTQPEGPCSVATRQHTEQQQAAPSSHFQDNAQLCHLSRQAVLAAFDCMTAMEAALQAPLLQFLSAHPRVRLWGSVATDPQLRVPTISFTHQSRTSREIATALQAAGFACRHGHMYAHRLIIALGLDPADGVVRLSLLHYNTPQEVQQLIEVLEAVL